DFHVTGVQTCALPIYVTSPHVRTSHVAHELHVCPANDAFTHGHLGSHEGLLPSRSWEAHVALHVSGKLAALGIVVIALITAFSRSEERRVGKEGSSGR